MFFSFRFQLRNASFGRALTYRKLPQKAEILSPGGWVRTIPRVRAPSTKEILLRFRLLYCVIVFQRYFILVYNTAVLQHYYRAQEESTSYLAGDSLYVPGIACCTAGRHVRRSRMCRSVAMFFFINPLWFVLHSSQHREITSTLPRAPVTLRSQLLRSFVRSACCYEFGKIRGSPIYT